MQIEFQHKYKTITINNKFYKTKIIFQRMLHSIWLALTLCIPSQCGQAPYGCLEQLVSPHGSSCQHEIPAWHPGKSIKTLSCNLHDTFSYKESYKKMRQHAQNSFLNFSGKHKGKSIDLYNNNQDTVKIFGKNSK